MEIKYFHDRIEIKGKMEDISEIGIDVPEVEVTVRNNWGNCFALAAKLSQAGNTVELVNEEAEQEAEQEAEPTKKTRASAPRVRYSDIQIQEVLDWVESSKETFGRQTVLKAEEKFGVSGSAIRGWMKKAKAE